MAPPQPAAREEKPEEALWQIGPHRAYDCAPPQMQVAC
jgi:hypothetical protein